MGLHGPSIPFPNKMKLKYLILLVLAFAINAQAQNYSTGLTYSMGFGIGSMSDYISNPAWAGFNIEGHRFLKPDVSVGLTTGWNIFSEKGNYTIDLPSASISGEQGRYFNCFPILLNASYYFKSKGSKVPIGPLRALEGMRL